ncbi:MAG TPA: hypothetical protein VGL56_03090 [Fimbriimonadaceae bacterium]|jgi:hypothetical protein
MTPILAGLLLITSVGASAQDGKDHAIPPVPKAKKAPKSKKKGPEVIVLKILDQSGATGQDSLNRSLYANVGILNDFDKKKIDIISPAEVMGTIDQLEIDYSKSDNWTPDNLDKLANPWEASYVAAAVINSIGEPKVIPGKTPMVSGEADITIWLYDVKEHKFLAQAQPYHCVYKNKKGDAPMDPVAVEYEVLMDATGSAFKPVLDAKKTPKAE